MTAGKHEGYAVEMNNVLWKITGIFLFLAAVVVASYWFNVSRHMVVVDHMPPVSDIPGAAFFDVTTMQSETGKKFARYMEEQTRKIEMPEYNLNVVLNNRKFFRLLAEAEANLNDEQDNIYRGYEERFEFDKKVVFTVIMHSAAGHLFDYDPKQFVILSANGSEYTHPEWQESNRSSEFHRRGVLSYPTLPGERSLNLILRDRSGMGPDKTLIW